jgi:hypothetical protein
MLLRDRSMLHADYQSRSTHPKVRVCVSGGMEGNFEFNVRFFRGCGVGVDKHAVRTDVLREARPNVQVSAVLPLEIHTCGNVVTSMLSPLQITSLPSDFQGPIRDAMCCSLKRFFHTAEQLSQGHQQPSFADAQGQEAKTLLRNNAEVWRRLILLNDLL